MRERKRYALPHTVYVNPGDILKCTVTEKNGEQHQFTEKIGRSLEVDTVVTFDVDEPILGLVDGIGAIFGKAQI